MKKTQVRGMFQLGQKGIERLSLGRVGHLGQLHGPPQLQGDRAEEGGGSWRSADGPGGWLWAQCLAPTEVWVVGGRSRAQRSWLVPG